MVLVQLTPESVTAIASILANLVLFHLAWILVISTVRVLMALVSAPDRMSVRLARHVGCPQATAVSQKVSSTAMTDGRVTNALSWHARIIVTAVVSVSMGNATAPVCGKESIVLFTLYRISTRHFVVLDSEGRNVMSSFANLPVPNMVHVITECAYASLDGRASLAS